MALNYAALEKDSEFEKLVASADRARAKTGHEKYLADLAEFEVSGRPRPVVAFDLSFCLSLSHCLYIVALKEFARARQCQSI